MAIRFANDEWTKALCQEVNGSQAYKEAAKKWEGDMYFIIEPEGNLKEKIVLYFDLWHGECRSAGVVIDETEKSPAYRFSGPLSVWRNILEKKLDPIQALMIGKLSFKGDIAQVMKMPRAAIELVNCATRIDTEFPW